MMEKILLGRRDKAPFIDELDASESRLNNVFASLVEFIPEPGIDDLRDVLKGGKDVKRLFAESASETLAGIKIPAFKMEQEAKLNKLSEELDAVIDKASRYKGDLISFIPDSMIELRNGQIRFSSESDTLIDEMCEIYIETDDQLQVYKLSRTLADTLNKLGPILKPYRCSDPIQSGVVGKDASGQWIPDDRYVIGMPATLGGIKAEEEYHRLIHEEEMAKRREKEERTKHYVTNPEHWPTASRF